MFPKISFKNSMISNFWLLTFYLGQHESMFLGSGHQNKLSLNPFSAENCVFVSMMTRDIKWRHLYQPQHDKPQGSSPLLNNWTKIDKTLVSPEKGNRSFCLEVTSRRPIMEGGLGTVRRARDRKESRESQIGRTSRAEPWKKKKSWTGGGGGGRSFRNIHRYSLEFSMPLSHACAEWISTKTQGEL